MKIAMGCDHGGYELKEHLKKYLTDEGYEIVDFGTDSTKSVDYPIYARAAAEAVASGACKRGIVICTTGIGVSITANKVRGIRCALCSDPLSASLTRRHNDANMIAFGAGIVGPKLAENMADIFLTTEFEGGRHARRVGLIEALDAERAGEKTLAQTEEKR